MQTAYLQKEFNTYRMEHSSGESFRTIKIEGAVIKLTPS